MTKFNGRVCTQYKKLPLCNPDFIYVDGPDQFKVKGHINGISTRHKDFMPMQSDLLKASDQKPVDQEQFLIQESLASDLEKTIVRVDEMMHNGVNIQRMIKDIERLRDDVEKLKDKVRENGNSYSSNNVSE